MSEYNHTGEPRPDEQDDHAGATPGQIIGQVEAGELGRFLGGFMTPGSRDEVLRHYGAHAEQLEPGETMGVVNATQLGTSEYEVRLRTVGEPEEFADLIGVSLDGAGYQEVFAVPVDLDADLGLDRGISDRRSI